MHQRLGGVLGVGLVEHVRIVAIVSTVLSLEILVVSVLHLGDRS
jgi:hypothetical protein